MLDKQLKICYNILVNKRKVGKTSGKQNVSKSKRTLRKVYWWSNLFQ